MKSKQPKTTHKKHPLKFVFETPNYNESDNGADVSIVIAGGYYPAVVRIHKKDVSRLVKLLSGNGKWVHFKIYEPKSIHDRHTTFTVLRSKINGWVISRQEPSKNV